MWALFFFLFLGIGAAVVEVTSGAELRIMRTEMSPGRVKVGNDTPLNIYGEALQRCSTTGTPAGSSQQSGGIAGMCDEQTGGIHSICVSSIPGDFSSSTGQSDWSSSEQGRPWCVCLGAWSLYHAKEENVAARCVAVPEFVLGSSYVSNWNTWNGNELANQIVDGVNALYNQCKTGQTGDRLAKLKEYYCRVAEDSTHVSEFSAKPEFTDAGCSSR